MPTFTGTAGDDTLTGGVGEDIVLGLNGNDTLSTGEVYIATPAAPLPVTNVRDVVRGGAGNDVITANGISNGATLYGEDGDDRITVGFSGVVQGRNVAPGVTAPSYTAVDGDAVQIFGGAGNDVLTALSHAIIDGGDGDDVLRVGPGNAFLNPFGPVYSTAAGFDTTVRLTGGTGADVFVISNPVGTAIITDFEIGVDFLNLAESGVLNYSQDLDGRIVLGRQGADTLLISRDTGAVYARLLNIDPSALGAATFQANVRQTVPMPFDLRAEYLNLAGPIYTVGTDGVDTIQGVGAIFWYGAGGNDVLRAGTGDSVLNGDDGDDLLVGGIGADTLRGGAGTDRLEGGAGADVLNGGAGIDILIGGAGADLLSGGIGLGDQFRYTAHADSNAASGYDTITDFQERYGNGAPSDVIDLSGLVTSSVTLVRTGRTGTLIFATTAEGTLQIASTQRIGGEDILTSGVAGVTIFGTDAPDIGELIIAGAGADTVYGLEGSDSIVGRQGADVLYGGAGIDRFYYWSAADSTAAASDVIMDFETGIDQILFDWEAFGPFYGVSSVSIVRSGGSSYIFSESPTGSSRIIALGRDVNGIDVFRSDNISIIGSDAADVIIGSMGRDAIRGGRGLDQLTGGLGADRFFYAAGDSTQTAIDSIADFQTGSDRIVLEGTITGLSLVRVANGATLIFADYASGPQTVIGVNGTIQASDVVGGNGQALSAFMVGSEGSDVLIGSGLIDTIMGGAGDDFLTGGDSNDTMTGGAGADQFIYQPLTGVGYDRITDFQTGVDVINLNAVLPASVRIQRLQNGDSDVRADYIPIYVQGTLQGYDFLLAGRTNIPIMLNGSSGADWLVGAASNDTISGGRGADALAGGLGADVFGYSDIMDSTASATDNLYDFETGIDRIGLGDIRAGLTAISIVRTDNGSSYVFADAATGGTLVISASGRAINGSDIIYGLLGVYMIGSANADVLVGSSLADPIQGGAGNDTITGGGGADVLFGEGGADTFVYRAASDSTVAAADTIFGFVSGTDRLDLSAVRTGASDTYGIAYANGGSFLFVDLGGNGTNDMLIQLAGTTLVASDIRWSASAGELEPTVKDAGPEVLPVSDDVDLGWSGLDTIVGGEMRFLADGALASARGHDWYL